MNDTFTTLKTTLGPGLIFAAAAVGTSHVVQSTRAGAGFGLTFALLILAVCFLKYPLFRFAADYAAISGESLVRGYARRGRWLVIVMFATSAIEAVAATAGVSLVTAAIGQWVFGTGFGAVNAAITLLIITGVLVAIGRYRMLESITGLMVVGFSLLTLVVTAASIPTLMDSPVPLFGAFSLTRDNVAFAIAVSGWMPIGNTAAIMLAAWILARRKREERPLATTRFDFDLGYVTSVILALCFLLMGTAVLYTHGTSTPEAAAAFVTTFVGLYTSAIGDWSAIVVSIVALTVMYSTLLAIVDGFPRMLAEFAVELGFNPRPRSEQGVDGTDPESRLYLPAMAAVILAAAALLLWFFGAFATFVDMVAITGFIAAPVVAIANQLVICGDNVPGPLRPGAWLIRWNTLAVFVLALATVGYITLRLS